MPYDKTKDRMIAEEMALETPKMRLKVRVMSYNEGEPRIDIQRQFNPAEEGEPAKWVHRKVGRTSVEEHEGIVRAVAKLLKYFEEPDVPPEVPA